MFWSNVYPVSLNLVKLCCNCSCGYPGRLAWINLTGTIEHWLHCVRWQIQKLDFLNGGAEQWKASYYHVHKAVVDVCSVVSSKANKLSVVHKDSGWNDTRGSPDAARKYFSCNNSLSKYCLINENVEIQLLGKMKELLIQMGSNSIQLLNSKLAMIH